MPVDSWFSGSGLYFPEKAKHKKHLVEHSYIQTEEELSSERQRWKRQVGRESWEGGLWTGHTAQRLVLDLGIRGSQIIMSGRTVSLQSYYINDNNNYINIYIPINAYCPLHLNSDSDSIQYKPFSESFFTHNWIFSSVNLLIPQVIY